MIIPWKGNSFYINKKLATNLDNYVDGVMNKNTSAVFLIDGKSGLGKTTFSTHVSCYIARRVAEWKDKHIPLPNGEKHEPDFSLDDLSWHPDEFIDNLKKATRGNIRIMDESMIFSNRSAMSVYNKAVVIMMGMIRSKQIFVMFNVNSFFDLDKNLVLSRADLLIHLFAEDDKFAVRGTYIVVPTRKGRLKNLYISGKKYYSYVYAHPVIRDRFTSFFPFDNEDYERRKQEAIQRYFSEDKHSMAKTKESRDNYIKILHERFGLTPQAIADLGGLSLRTIQRVLSLK